MWNWGGIFINLGDFWVPGSTCAPLGGDTGRRTSVFDDFGEDFGGVWEGPGVCWSGKATPFGAVGVARSLEFEVFASTSAQNLVFLSFGDTQGGKSMIDRGCNVEYI